jgi:transcription initiation factor IIE alpha subunit
MTLLKEFKKRHTVEELMCIPDITKRAIREYLETIYGQYGIVFQTDDESDSCAVLHYWRTKTYISIDC